MFDKTSRYSRIPESTIVTPEGRQVTYKQRRFLPQGASMRIISSTTAQEGDRLDLIAARTLGSAEMAWRICDANNAMNPFDLADPPGTVLHVPMPQHT